MSKQDFENDCHVTDNAVIEEMATHGGGFASRLAVACRYADAENLSRIKTAFPDLWACYRDIAEFAKSKAVAA